MLSLTTKERVTLFNEHYYNQMDGVTMSSPLGPALLNIFLCAHESYLLKTSPKPSYQSIIKDMLVTFYIV